MLTDSEVLLSLASKLLSWACGFHAVWQHLLLDTGRSKAAHSGPQCHWHCLRRLGWNEPSRWQSADPAAREGERGGPSRTRGTLAAPAGRPPGWRHPAGATRPAPPGRRHPAGAKGRATAAPARQSQLRSPVPACPSPSESSVRVHPSHLSESIRVICPNPSESSVRVIQAVGPRHPRRDTASRRARHLRSLAYAEAPPTAKQMRPVA
jgi:hypothetical protein